MDIYNQQQYQDFNCEVQLILNTIQLKQLIIQTSQFKDYLNQYEEYLLKCVLDYNKTKYTPYIQIYFYQLQDNISKEYKKIHFTQKQYFTIGKYGDKKIKLKKDLNINTVIDDVIFQVNEVVINKVTIDFMHLEVNYEDLIRKKGKTEYFSLLDKELTNLVSYQTKSKIWHFEKKGQEKLKIKSLSFRLDPALIKISENSYNLSLQKGQVYKLGDGRLFINQITIIEQFDTAKKYLQDYKNQQNVIKYLGIPDQINMNINLLEDQDSQIKEILNASTLVISIKFTQSRILYVLIAYQKRQFSIGSFIDNDIIIDEQDISEYQSEIIYKQNLNIWEIVDLFSDYGTWLILQQEQYYRIGKKTIIKLGSEAFQFQAILNEQDLINKKNNTFQQKKVKDQAIAHFIEEILSI